MPFVYIVRCADGTLYTGYAVDVSRRVAAHNAGSGARYTAGRRPVAVVYTEACSSRGAALRREHQLKQLARREKEALIAAARDAGERTKSGGGARRHRRRPGRGGTRTGMVVNETRSGDRRP